MDAKLDTLVAVDGFKAILRRVSGILSGPIGDGKRRKPGRPKSGNWPKVEAVKGVVVRHRTTNYAGPIRKFTPRQVTLFDKVSNREVTVPVADGAFSVKGKTVSLVPPRPQKASSATGKTTASGSRSPGRSKARVALPSRILVEGLHDAELVEKVWGDDLRVEGVVVEPLHGADDLASIVDDFEPADDRRLGVLLDHLVANTKESYIAEKINNPHVLITGHPFVDVWQAVKPATLGIRKWPVVPKGQDWKTGICSAWNFEGEPGELWKKILGRVNSYADLEPGLVGAVEQLIDFVAPPPTDD